MDMPHSAVDQNRLQELLGRLVVDIAAAATAPLVVLGERLGLYPALAGGVRLTSAELADATGTHERNVREWLAAQVTAGYVGFDPAEDRYFLSPEQEMAFADEDSPAFIIGAFETQASVWDDRHKVEAAFRSGRGLGWHERSDLLFCGCERFFRSGYRAHLVHDWLPAVPGAVEKLERGARVADVGCGHGAATILMAQAFPNSVFVGSDYHPASIARARLAAEAAGVAGRVSFEAVAAESMTGGPFDLIAIFDALHDMGDPVGAAAQIRRNLAQDGVLMVVEPLAGDSLAENLNPVSRAFYAGSAMICTPASMSRRPSLALGAQAGERRLAEVLLQAGFSSIRRVAQTPFNMVLEVRH